MRIHINELTLQPLRIPEGWTVSYNSFFAIDPDGSIQLEGVPEASVWEVFLQDMLQLVHLKHQFLLDLGWVSEASPEGEFLLTLVYQQNWREPTYEFTTRSRTAIVAKLEELMAQISAGQKPLKK
jgi:hypothetical protein